MAERAPERAAGLVLVGRVAGAFGVRGELRITSYTQEPLALLGYRDLLDAEGRRVLTLASARPGKGPEIVALAPEVASKEAADALRGARLHVPRSALPSPEEDEFYLHDLIGLLAETADGAPLGRIKAVLDHGAGDILEIDPGGGRPSRLLPFTREVVPEVRIAEGRLLVVEPVEVSAQAPDPSA